MLNKAGVTVEEYSRASHPSEMQLRVRLALGIFDLQFRKAHFGLLQYWGQLFGCCSVVAPNIAIRYAQIPINALGSCRNRAVKNKRLNFWGRCWVSSESVLVALTGIEPVF